MVLSHPGLPGVCLEEGREGGRERKAEGERGVQEKGWESENVSI